MKAKAIASWPRAAIADPVVIHDLDIVQDPHDLSYKIPGLVTWTTLALSVIGAWLFPRVVLAAATVVALYMLVRILIVLGFYIVGTLQCRRWARDPLAGAPKAPATDGLRPEDVYHVVLVANYREPVEVLARTLEALAVQENAAERLIVVLAMEEAEPEARAKAAELQARFAGRFADILATYHPAGLPGEIRGKGSNLRWAAEEVRRELVERRHMALERLTLTSSDADSLFHPRYFGTVSRLFATDPQRYLRFWQAPLLLDNNVWRVPTIIRLFTFMTNAVHLSEQSNAAAFPLPLSSFTLSFKLAEQVGYWDPAVIADDTHVFMRCYFATRGQVRLMPVFLPTRGDTVEGVTFWQALVNFYRQKLRHGWGCQDASYVLQQWKRVRGMSFGQKVLPLIKSLHDHLIFSVGSIMVLIGTLLSISLYGNPIITLPTGFPYPILWQVANAVGAVGLWSTWIAERVRVSSNIRQWRLSTLILEILGWGALPAASFVMLGLPVLHAQTKMMLGSQLAFERTPKACTPTSVG
jgi:cellulose synthase/poly-beta-1,6-N-acetylglucosamine synthase-like glycosyltransferase